MPSLFHSVGGHNVIQIDGVTFSSNFDNGNLYRVERGTGRYEYLIWTASDNAGSSYETKQNAWFHFVVTGLPQGSCLKLQIMNTSKHSALYKYDMRPVFRSNSTNQKWIRIKTLVKFERQSAGGEGAYIGFEHTVDLPDDKISFAFTYPYTYTMVQNDLASIDNHINNLNQSDALYCKRELLIESPEGRRIDLVTITSSEGASNESEPLLPGLFPMAAVEKGGRPLLFPKKEIVFVSARVHPGEVPAQHTFKGLYNFLMDEEDVRAKALRKRYVFKLMPMLNPDGVYRGHFRMDQYGQNLNRYYIAPDPSKQPAIFAAKQCIDYYASIQKLAFYLDLHAHSSKRGCFIYGNVMDSLADQIQNQLLCKLIALNTPHFDYDGCLFSRDHMIRVDPGEQDSGLTAEGSGRVSTYLQHHIIHSYTLECNYNTGKIANEVPPTDGDPGGRSNFPPSAQSNFPEKYTPSSYASVGQACMIALLDIRGNNPCSRISKSRYKTLDRMRFSVMSEVKLRSEYKGQVPNNRRRMAGNKQSQGSVDDLMWKRCVGADAIDGGGEGSKPNPVESLEALKAIKMARARRGQSTVPPDRVAPNVVSGSETGAQQVSSRNVLSRSMHDGPPPPSSASGDHWVLDKDYVNQNENKLRDIRTHLFEFPDNTSSTSSALDRPESERDLLTVSHRGLISKSGGKGLVARHYVDPTSSQSQSQSPRSSVTSNSSSTTRSEAISIATTTAAANVALRHGKLGGHLAANTNSDSTRSLRERDSASSIFGDYRSDYDSLSAILLVKEKGTRKATEAIRGIAVETDDNDNDCLILKGNRKPLSSSILSNPIPMAAAPVPPHSVTPVGYSSKEDLTNLADKDLSTALRVPVYFTDSSTSTRSRLQPEDEVRVSTSSGSRKPSSSPTTNNFQNRGGSIILKSPSLSSTGPNTSSNNNRHNNKLSFAADNRKSTTSQWGGMPHDSTPMNEQLTNIQTTLAVTSLVRKTTSSVQGQAQVATSYSISHSTKASNNNNNLYVGEGDSGFRKGSYN